MVALLVGSLGTDGSGQGHGGKCQQRATDASPLCATGSPHQAQLKAEGSCCQYPTLSPVACNMTVTIVSANLDSTHASKCAWLASWQVCEMLNTRRVVKYQGTGAPTGGSQHCSAARGCKGH